VRLLPLKFLNASGTGTTADAIEALDYAVGLGVPITNNSWGGGSSSQALLDAIAAADAAGTLFVTIAGGSSRNIDDYPVYPACYDVPNVIVAAATTDTDSLYPPSGYGPKAVDLGAPGADILTTRPGSSYGMMSGSSMSAAYTAGALALLLARYPFLPPADAATHLLDRVEVLPSLAGLVRTGGRLDAYRPVAEAPITAVAEGHARGDGGARARLWWRGASGEGAQLGLYLPRAGEARLQIVDVQGRRVRTLVLGTVAAGSRTIRWDGRDDRGVRAASGVYLASLTGSMGRAVTRVVLLR
jgi:subtilisin family serine protease